MRTRIPVVPIVSIVGMAGLVLLLILWNEGASDSGTPRSGERALTVLPIDGSESAIASGESEQAPLPAAQEEDLPGSVRSFDPSVVRTSLFGMDAIRMDVGEETGDPRRAKLLIHLWNEAGRPLSGLQGVTARHGRMMWFEEWTTDEQGLLEIHSWPDEAYNLDVHTDDLTLRTKLNCALGHVNSISLYVPKQMGVPVTGSVIDRRSGPVSGVEVTLERDGAYGSWMSVSYRTSTDRYGIYEFAAVPAGDYLVCVLASAQKEQTFLEASISVPEIGSVQRDLLIGVRTIHGTVRCANSGEPIENSNVAARSHNTWFLGQIPGSDRPGNGAFRLLDLPPGIYELYVFSAGYVSAEIGGIEVTKGEETCVDVLLLPAPVLSMIVYSPDGVPYNGQVWVSVGSSVDGPGKYVNTVRVRGRVEIDSLPAGEHRIRVRATDVGTAEATVHLVRGRNELTVHLEPIPSDGDSVVPGENQPDSGPVRD